MTEPLPWTRIYNRVKTQIPAAPDALIRQEFYDVMVDFTQDTNMWIEEVPFTIQPNVVSYPVTVTTGKPNRLMLVYNVDPNNMYDGNRYRWADNGITMRVPGTIVLYNNPAASANWVAVIAKAVDQNRLDDLGRDTGYPEVDDWIVDTYNDCIYYGVMALLQRMPAKPFNSPAAAKENGAAYQSQKSQARVNNQRSNIFGGQAWTYPQSFRTTTRKGWA